MSAVAAGQNTWEEKNEAGEKAFQEGHIAEANTLFSEALKDAQKFGPTDVRLAPIYNNLGLVAFVQSNFIASEDFYKRAIAAMQPQGLDNPLLLPVLDNLTTLYVKQWAFGKAIQTSWRAYNIRDNKFGASSPETAVGLNKVAMLLLQSVLVLPESPSNKSVAAPSPKAVSLASTSDSQLEPLLQNATTLDDATRLAVAEVLLRRVLTIQEEAYGRENTRLVDVLENLGGVLQAEGQTDAAMEAYARALAIVEKSFGSNDPRLSTPLQQLAGLRKDQGDFQQAATLYQRALQIEDAHSDTTNPSLVSLLNDYADLLLKMNKPEEARSLSERARSLRPSAPVKVSSDTDLSVPYIVRFEKSVFDPYAGFQQTCVLVRADGRLRVEEQQHGPNDRSISGTQIRPGMVGGNSETFAERSDTATHGKVYETSLDAASMQQLKAILSAEDIRNLQGIYPQHGQANAGDSEKVSASILRENGVQNFVFPDRGSRQHYENSLKPLDKWISNAEKRKGAVLKGATANNCLPDPPNASPIQVASLRRNPPPNGNEAPPAKAATAPPSPVGEPTTLKVNVNLVLVRVVARDSHGHAVGNLRQEDFRLLDDGKSQAITRFSVEQSEVGTPESIVKKDNAAAVERGNPSVAEAPVERSIAYLFDDVHLRAGEWNQLRSAADHRLSSLPAGVAAAIFTTSGQTTQDFTRDPAQLHQALLRVRPSVDSTSACPHVDTYMADLIVNKRDEAALGTAAQDALDCAFGDDPRLLQAAESLAKTTAQQQLASAAAQNQRTLAALETVLRRLSAAPGQHALVLVSPGFVAPGLEQAYGQLIDYALRSNITISSLDVRGLYLADTVDRRSTGVETGASRYRRDSAAANDDILAALAYGTGGVLVQNNSDLGSGLDRVAGAPEYSYVLAFSPSQQELDGRFHKLTVTLNGQSSLTLQARKGYYARKP